MSAPTCLSCVCKAFLFGEASGIAIILTARLSMASSLPSDVSEAAIHTDKTYSILDLASLLCIPGSAGFARAIPVRYPASFYLAALSLSQDVF